MNYTDEQSIHPLKRKGLLISLAFIGLVLSLIYLVPLLVIYLVVTL